MILILEQDIKFVTVFSSVTYYRQCRPISCLARISLNWRPYVKSGKL